MIVLGRVTAPFGVRGWLKVHPFADDPERWGAIAQWWLGHEENWRAFRLQECRAHGGGLIAKLEGADDRAAAQALTGLDVAAPRELLPAPAVGEFYWADLIGLQVVNVAGESLGRVESLIETGASQVLCVRAGDAERLIPFVAPVIADVDLVARVIRADWQADW